MDDPRDLALQQSCDELMSEIRAQIVASLQERGDLAGFVQWLLEFERGTARAKGFVLTASNTLDEWTILVLRPQRDSRVCAALEFHSADGAIRPVTALRVDAGPQAR